MAFLTLAARWVANIYQLATTDPVLGGALPTGISNQQAQELGDRTEFLKLAVDSATDRLDNIHPVGLVQWLAGPAYNSADYDLADPASPTYGAGVVGTPAENWCLCFGALGTVDLRGKFVVGMDPASVDYDQPGRAGGRATNTLTVPNLPAHSHRISAGVSDNNGTTGNGGAYAKSPTTNGNFDGNRRTDDAGSATPTPLDNRPPYYVLVARQRISN